MPRGISAVSITGKEGFFKDLFVSAQGTAFTTSVLCNPLKTDGSRQILQAPPTTHSCNKVQLFTV